MNFNGHVKFRDHGTSFSHGPRRELQMAGCPVLRLRNEMGFEYLKAGAQINILASG